MHNFFLTQSIILIFKLLVSLICFFRLFGSIFSEDSSKLHFYIYIIGYYSVMLIFLTNIGFDSADSHFHGGPTHFRWACCVGGYTWATCTQRLFGRWWLCSSWLPGDQLLLIVFSSQILMQMWVNSHGWKMQVPFTCYCMRKLFYFK